MEGPSAGMVTMIGGSARPGRLPEGLAAGGDVEMAQDLAASEIRAALTLTRRAALVAHQGQSRPDWW